MGGVGRRAGISTHTHTHIYMYYANALYHWLFLPKKHTHTHGESHMARGVKKIKTGAEIAEHSEQAHHKYRPL